MTAFALVGDLPPGANDVVNPLANTDESSPSTGVPVFEVTEPQTGVANKRSLNPGFSEIPNPLFAEDSCNMLFGGAKDSIQVRVNQYKDATS